MMDSRNKKIEELILEINHLLGSETGSLVPLVTKAIRLADLRNDAEYKFLFELHLNGVDGTIQWPKNQKLRWDVGKVLCDDRRTMHSDQSDKNKNVTVHSLQQLEHLKNTTKGNIDLLDSQGLTGETGTLRASEYDYITVLGRIRNRVGEFVRRTEAALLREQKNTDEELGTMSPPLGKKIFIGHGGKSRLWMELKDFISDRLHLPYDEFNRTSSAGKSTKERLEEMLDESCFAFLIMTAEDEHADQTVHARENVIHEIGLFQGRLGFSKAVVLLEDGCSEFSNIHGITQLRFPKENIQAIYEDLRKVLEREGVLSAEKHSR